MESGSVRGAISQRSRAKRIWSVFGRTAEVLERSADLADEHARRCAQFGRGDDAVRERQLAAQARNAAQRARLHAASWEELFRSLDELEHLAEERSRKSDERERAADERERAADERERMADERERATDELEARLEGDRAQESGGARHRSQVALRLADEAVGYAQAGMRRLAAERQAREENAAE